MRIGRPNREEPPKRMVNTILMIYKMFRHKQLLRRHEALVYMAVCLRACRTQRWSASPLRAFIRAFRFFPGRHISHITRHLGSMSSAPALIVQERVGRGRGLVAARELHAGEVVLNEPPLILTPSSRCVQHVCCFCLAVVDGRCMFHHCSHQHPRQAPPPPAQPAA